MKIQCGSHGKDGLERQDIEARKISEQGIFRTESWHRRGPADQFQAPQIKPNVKFHFYKRGRPKL